jgi:hypothetical protein
MGVHNPTGKRHKRVLSLSRYYKKV